MKSLVLFLKFILTVVLLAGCASEYKKGEAPKQNAAVAAAPSAQASSQLLASNDMHAYPISWVGSSNCPQSSGVDKTNDWQELVKFANRCLSQKNTKQLAYIGNRLAEIAPNLPWGSFYLSLEAELQNQDERSLWMIDLALKKAPKIGVLKYQKGRLLWKKGFYKESVKEIEDALKLDSSINEAHLMLGEAYLSELDFSTARGHFEKVLSTNASNFYALTGLADVYIELENPSAALGVLQSAIISYPKNLNFRLKEAFVYENLTQQTDLALFKFKEIQKLVAKKVLEGSLSFDLSSKIKDLESTVKSTRQLASTKESKERK